MKPITREELLLYTKEMLFRQDKLVTKEMNEIDFAVDGKVTVIADKIPSRYLAEKALNWFMEGKYRRSESNAVHIVPWERYPLRPLRLMNHRTI